MIHLGPFRLDARIGAGGMAEVWRATHASGAHVAIKVMTDSLAKSAEWRAGFMREIRATAGLDHPNIVRLYDAGVVPEAAAELGLVPGSPWVAMELAETGDLVNAWPAHWGALRRILFDVLDALAHAHARGVIHRDLKPANVLVAQVDGTPSLRLTDFGIAHVHTEEQVLGTKPNRQVGSGGTPEYMAPEQVTGRIAEQGPWTDLYALGCMAYTLAAGRAPFEGPNPLAVAMRHVTDDAPPMQPRFAVPMGFEAWVKRLMHREPGARYQCAADAAYALMQLAEGFTHEMPTDPFDVALSDTIAALHTMALSIDDLDWSVSGVEVAPDFQPPLPATWRSMVDDKAIAAAPLQDAGLGLIGVRRPPLVGRALERDILWRHLAEAHDGAPAQIVVLRGPHGIGTSSLARAFCERAAEVGGAEVYQARHQPIDTADDGIGAMLQRHFGAISLDDDATRAHIQRRVPGPDGELLAEAALWHAERATSFESADVRHGVLRRYLADRAERRPVVLFIDEGQWGGDTLTFLRALMRQAPPRLLVVVAYDEGGAGQSSTESQTQWARLSTHPRCTHLTLPPIDGDEYCDLINGLLPMSGAMRVAIKTRTHGNPRFAHELLLGWVEQGWLRPGDGGFELTDEADPWVPDLADALERRFMCAVNGDDSAMQVLEVAAVIGVQVKSATWVAVCRALGLALPVGLVDRLLQRGLIQLRVGGWAFSTPTAMFALRQRAKAGGRSAHFNLVCARILQPQGRPVGTYLYRAGAYREVIPHILAWIRRNLEASEYGRMLVSLQYLQRPMDALDLPESDPWRIEARLLEVQAHRFLTGIDRAAELLASISTDIDDLPPHLAAMMARLRANCAPNDVGMVTRARLYRLARARFVALGDDKGIADCLHGEGIMEMVRGALDSARACMAEAVQRARKVDAKRTMAWAAQGLAMVKTFQDDPTGAADAQLALDTFIALKTRSGMAAAYFSVGDSALLLGDLARAEQAFTRAIEIFEAIDSRMQMLPMAQLGLATVAARRDHMALAAERLAAFDMKMTDRVFETSHLQSRFHGLAMRVAASLRDAAAVARHAEALERFTGMPVITEVRDNVLAALPLVDPATRARLDRLTSSWRAATPPR